MALEGVAWCDYFLVSYTGHSNFLEFCRQTEVASRDNAEKYSVDEFCLLRNSYSTKL